MTATRSAPLLVGAVLFVSLAIVGSAPAQNPVPADVQGQRLFLRCASCHAITATAPVKIGPNLRGVVGRKAGSMPGYDYSAAMKAQSFVWDEPTLDRWLTRPNAVVPGTSMAFAGLPKPEDRKAVIAYLKKAGS